MEQKSLRERMEALEQQKRQEEQLSPAEKDKKAKAELEAFTEGITKRKVHQKNNTLPSSPVKEEKQEPPNLDKPLHEMTMDERIEYATIHKQEIEEKHYTDDKTLKKKKGYAFSALAEAILGTIFDTPDEFDDELDEADDVL